MTAVTGPLFMAGGLHGSVNGSVMLMPVPGSAATGTPWCAVFITRLQISTGRPPPVILRVGEESSLPSQTPATRCDV